MEAQLTLFTNSGNIQRPSTEVYAIPSGVVKLLSELNIKSKRLDLTLRSNREYIVFSKRMLRTTIRLSEQYDLSSFSLRRAFNSRLFVAKRELTEIKSWLELMEQGMLLKGSYKRYMDEVQMLLEHVKSLIVLLK